MTTNVDRAKLSEAITQAVSEALETMAFSEAMPADPDATRSALTQSPTTRAVRIAIDAPIQSQLTIFYSPDLALDLTGAMYGGALPDGVDPDTIAQDVMNEFVNTFVGRVLFTMFPESPPMRIGIPEAIANANSESIEATDTILAFDVSGKALMVRCRCP